MYSEIILDVYVIIYVCVCMYKHMSTFIHVQYI